MGGNVPFDMITDETRNLYKFFELKISYLKVWIAETLIYYSEQKLMGKVLPTTHADAEDDPHQMGGNFVMEFKGGNEFEIVFRYPSQIPPDRPDVGNLVKFLRERN